MLYKGSFAALLSTALFSAMLTLPAATLAKTERIIIEDGNAALSNEQAHQSKEQWNESRTLRKKLNNRKEKEFDKTEHATDFRERCEKSTNLNTYWESNTRRCLDRRSGQEITP